MQMSFECLVKLHIVLQYRLSDDMEKLKEQRRKQYPCSCAVTSRRQWDAVRWSFQPITGLLHGTGDISSSTWDRGETVPGGCGWLVCVTCPYLHKNIICKLWLTRVLTDSQLITQFVTIWNILRNWNFFSLLCQGQACFYSHGGKYPSKKSVLQVVSSLHYSI